MSPLATTSSPQQSITASSTTTLTIDDGPDPIHGAHNDASDHTHRAAAASLNNNLRRGPGARLTDSPTRTNIALQPLSSSNATFHSTATANGGTDTYQSSGTQVVVQQPTTRRPGLVGWLTDKGCTIWNWVMGVVMLALTAGTYVLTKLQSAMSDGQRIQQGLLRSQEWHNKSEYLKYCKDEEAAGRPLLESCQTALKDGLDDPVDRSSNKAHTKRGDPQQDLDSAQRKAKNALNDAESRVSGAKNFLSALPNPLLLGRGVRRRLARLFRSGRRLGTGQQTYALPTFESSLSAMAFK